MSKHIGIVSLSPEGSALCFRKLAHRISAIADPAQRPLLTIHSHPLETYLEAIRDDDWERVGQMLRWSAETLAASGAEFCILPDNVAHHALHYAEPGSPIPWISMIDLVAQSVCDDQRQTVGVIGTDLVMRGSVYQTVLGMRGVVTLAPNDEDAESIDRIIFEELVHGRFEESSRDIVSGAILRMAQQGCEAVILGSTEAPLLMTPAMSPLPTYDPVELLIEAAMSHAVCVA